MKRYVYNGTNHEMDGMLFVNGNEYDIEAIGNSNGMKKRDGVLGALGLYKPIGNCYFVNIYSQGKKVLCAYSSKSVFDRIWTEVLNAEPVYENVYAVKRKEQHDQRKALAWMFAPEIAPFI